MSTLPSEIKRNFALLRELDQRTKETLDRIERDSKECFAKTTKSELEKRRDGRDRIRQYYVTCLELADEKVGLAVQTYEMVDKNIRRLDVDLRKFEQELEQQGSCHKLTITNGS